MLTRHILICGLPRSTIFFHLVSYTARFSGGGLLSPIKCVYDFLYNFYQKYVSFQKEMSDMWSKMYIGLHVKGPLFLSDFNAIFHKKYSNIKFHENPSSDSPDAPCGHTDGRTVMTKLTVAFHNFANVPCSKHARICINSPTALSTANYERVTLQFSHKIW